MDPKLELATQALYRAQAAMETAWQAVLDRENASITAYDLARAMADISSTLDALAEGET